MPKTFEHDLDVVGLGFRLKKDVRRALAGRCPVDGVKLVREQENKYDINAIRVVYPNSGALAGKQIGYIRADSAAILAPLMDEGELVFKRGSLTRLIDGPNGENCEGHIHVVFTDKRK